MRTETGCLIIAGTVLSIFIIWLICTRGAPSSYSEAYKALRELEKQLKAGNLPPEIDRLDPARVIMVQYLPNWREGFEGGVGNDPAKWWGTVGDPQAPYQFSHGGAWPPGMYSRLRQWSPGYDTTTNWSWAFSPRPQVQKMAEVEMGRPQRQILLLHQQPAVFLKASLLYFFPRIVHDF